MRQNAFLNCASDSPVTTSLLNRLIFTLTTTLSLITPSTPSPSTPQPTETCIVTTSSTNSSLNFHPSLRAAIESSCSCSSSPPSRSRSPSPPFHLPEFTQLCMQAISVYENLPWNILSNSSTPTTKSNSFFILIPLAKYSAITSVELKLLRKVVEVMGRSEVFVTVIDTSGCYSGDGGAAVDYSSFVPTGIFTIKSCIDVLNGKIFSDSNSNSNNDNNKKDADSKPAVISYKNFTFNASLVSTHNDNDPPPPSSLKVTKFVPRGSILPHALALTRSGLFSTNINGSMPLARFLALCSREGVDALVAGTAGGGSSSKLFLLAGRTFGEAALCEVVDEVEAEVEVEVEGELEFDFDFDCDELLPVALLFCR